MFEFHGFGKHIKQVVGRLKLHEKFKFWRAKVAKDCDYVFTGYMATLVTNATTRSEFVVAHDVELHALVDMRHARAVESAVECKEAFPLDALAELLSSEVGLTLFRDEATRMRYTMYLAKIGKILDNLEYHDFDSTELQSFKDISKAEGTHLLSSGAVLNTKPQHIAFMSGSVKIATFTINDEWSWRLAARAHALAVSLGFVPRMPWESLLSQPSPIPGMPLAVLIPE